MFVTEPVTGFIHAVSPVKKKRGDSSVQWIEFKIQTENKIQRGITFDVAENHQKLQEVEESKSPVKIVNYKMKDNKFAGSRDLQVHSKTVFEPVTFNFPFKEIAVEPNELAPYVSVENIKTQNDLKMASVTAYVDCNSIKTTEIIAKGNRKYTKYEASVNDQMIKSIKAVFWNDFGKEISKPGVYNLVNMKVSSFRDQIYIETCYKSKITYADDQKSIKLVETDMIAGLPYVTFPADEIISISRKRLCPKCKSLFEDVEGKLLSCTSVDCSYKVLPKKIQSFYTVKALFSNPGCSITFLPDEMNKFINMTDLTHSSNEDDVAITMLSVENMQAFYRKYVCVTIKATE